MSVDTARLRRIAGHGTEGEVRWALRDAADEIDRLRAGIVTAIDLLDSGFAATADLRSLLPTEKETS